MRYVNQAIFAVFVTLVLLHSTGFSQETSPIFKETKIKNYLPHMSWVEVEQALKRTDMVIIPVGAIEQHGKHLPLCTDIYAAIEISKLIAQETDVLVAPVVFAGLSRHHMDFPGTMTLSAPTFEAVVFECIQSLIYHGFRKFLIYNGHGGNDTSVNKVIYKVNQTTQAAAVLLSGIETAPESVPLDYHAGEGETSSTLYLQNSLVDMSRAEKPVLTIPPDAQKAMDNIEEDTNLQQVINAYMFSPKVSGKKGSSREMTNNGVFTAGDPKNATVERGRKKTERFVKAAVKFIEAWKKISR